MSGPPPLTTAAEERFWHGVEAAGRFFLGEADVQKALVKLGRTLDSDGIAYAVIDAMALNEFGYRRMTVDLNVLLTAEGLAAFKEAPSWPRVRGEVSGEPKRAGHRARS